MSKTPYEPQPILSEAELEDYELSENAEWVEVGNIEERREEMRQAALAHLHPKRKRISISIPERDLARLKTRAAEQGMPYQTLINSILHQYVER